MSNKLSNYHALQYEAHHTSMQLSNLVIKYNISYRNYSGIAFNISNAPLGVNNQPCFINNHVNVEITIAKYINILSRYNSLYKMMVEYTMPTIDGSI